MKKAIAFIFSICFTANINAAVIAPDSGWHVFNFGDVGSPFSTTYDFTLTQASILTVTDAYLSGDRFEIFSGATSLGLTSTPTSTGDQINNDFDFAASDDRWSTGVWALLAGTYTISGITIDSPFQGGGAALRVDTSEVPVPAAMFLFAPALLGFMGLRRKAKNIA